MNIEDRDDNYESKVLKDLDFVPDWDSLVEAEVDDFGLPEGEWAKTWLSTLLNSCIVNLKGSHAPYGMYQISSHTPNMFPDDGESFGFNTELKKIQVEDDNGDYPSSDSVVTRLGLLRDPEDKWGTVVVQRVTFHVDDEEEHKENYLLGILTAKGGKQHFAIGYDNPGDTGSAEVFTMDSLYSFLNLMPVPHTTSNLETIEYVANLCALIYRLPPMKSRTPIEIVEDHLLDLLNKLAGSVVPLMPPIQRRAFYQSLLEAALPFAVTTVTEMLSLLYTDVDSVRAKAPSAAPDPMLLPQMLHTPQTPSKMLETLRTADVDSIKVIEKAGKSVVDDLGSRSWDNLTLNSSSPMLSGAPDSMLELWGSYLIADSRFSSKARAEHAAADLIFLLGKEGYDMLHKSLKQTYGLQVFKPE